jgi:peroxiredoxin Q/BCP
MRALFVLLLVSLAAAARAEGPEVGDPAPDFTLMASDGRSYTLSDFRGKQAVVVAWFPKAYTRGCTSECRSLAENGHLIRRYDVAYFMASVDPLEDSRGFAKQQQADFPLLSDPDKRAAKAFGVLHPLGYARRQTFYVGVDGRILAIDRDVRPETAAQDMAAKLGELGIARAPARDPS